MKKLTALYSRSATDDKKAIDKQTTKLTNYCEANNILDFKHYVDNNQSGTSKNRPELDQLIKDLEDGKIDRVIVTNISRLSRDMHHFTMLINSAIEANNAKLITLDDDKYNSSDYTLIHDIFADKTT
ncbi:hypothetical protein NRIC_14920 [Enterococcus florum]|uniref:Resolvase/invertase-type recombinase catalytic domain-containing protein n=1 Tax=Enterococcus florum TaxID=2480627 RepID=A0A4P5PBD5_9ENTE|nr:recombinase family protein [Enterococcus florum]GCF93601.1 hypothetical protein NRIC_14920 [Enterococcus florum]